MGAEISKNVHSQLEHSTIESLLCDEKVVEELWKSIPKLCKAAQKGIQKLRKRDRSRYSDLIKPGKVQKKLGKGRSGHVPNSSSSTASNANLASQDAAPRKGLGPRCGATKGGVVTSLGEDLILGEVVTSFDQDPRLQSLWELKEDAITLPLEIDEFFLKWKADPSTLICGDSSKIPSSPTEYYDYARRIQTSLISKKILWRFVTTALYDTVFALSRSDRYVITKEVVAFMVAVICESSSYERQTVERDISKWVREGKKNRSLANLIGGTGCYFLYPTQISERTWTWYLPRERYNQAAELLRRLGILEKAQKYGAMDLANSIEHILKTPFQSTVRTQSAGEWIFRTTLGNRVRQDGHVGNEDIQVRPLEDEAAQQDTQTLVQIPDDVILAEAMDVDSLTPHESAPARQRWQNTDFDDLSSTSTPIQHNLTSSASQGSKSSSAACSPLTNALPSSYSIMLGVTEMPASREGRRSCSTADDSVLTEDSTNVPTVHCTTSTLYPSNNSYSQLQSTHDSLPWRKTAMDPQAAELCTSPRTIHSTPAKSLLLLLHSLGCSGIREQILFQGLSTQKRWNNDGNLQEVTVLEAGLNEHNVHLFSSRMALDQAIKSCVQNDSIVRNDLEDGSVAYSLTGAAQIQTSSSSEQSNFFLQGLLFITHVFPKEEVLHDSFHSVGRLLLPYLERLWDHALQEPCPTLPPHGRKSLAEASLAASRLIGGSHVNRAIAVAAKMHEVGLPWHLQLAITNRQSVLLRLKGEHDTSDVLIQNVLNTIPIMDILSHCAYGRLLLSKTENAILRKEFDKAASYLQKWEAKSIRPSDCELHVIRLKNTVFGRVSRYQGDFLHAQACLVPCLGAIPSETSRYHIMHHLADVYCELQLPDKAEDLLKDGIEDLKIRGKQCSKPFRRLLLPWAEACMQQRKLEEAREAFLQLDAIFDRIVGHDVSDQLDHVRSAFGLVRIFYHESRWSEALEASEKAFDLMQKYKTFSEGNFYIGVVLMFRTIICFKLGQLLESRKAFARAKLCDLGPRYFIPGIGTYVLDLLKSTVGSLQQLLTA